MTSGLLKIGRSDFALRTLTYSSVLFLVTAVKAELITPLKHKYLFGPLSDSTVVLLPLGIIVIVSFFEGKQAPLFLVPGALLSQLTYFDPAMPNIDFFAILVVNICTASIVFCVLDWTTLCNRREDMMHSRAWRLLLFGGFVASLLISLLVHSIEENHSVSCAHTAQIVLLNAIGYLIGLFVVLGVLAMLFRYTPGLKKNVTIARCDHSKTTNGWNNDTE
ncbi:hypothetical protein TRL7639_00833 [Falsiruegeria litorea R37]|uniref:Uncharacterized protein n=1 Tax=Falsiruegeria litorea R37 TaxID=1200284 RepID=A0A1Y5RTB8_9RHOB|nr:hypothetical protein [Falsiruegeria litorea]SLN24926.1 hypothetical protein TRL7639_00833 [Falsiruegeria litorea R37]